jgi:hypothetical protein
MAYYLTQGNLWNAGLLAINVVLLLVIVRRERRERSSRVPEHRKA